MSNRMSDEAREVFAERKAANKDRTTYISQARRNKALVRAAFGGAR